jgi:hypothetical protein
MSLRRSANLGARVSLGALLLAACAGQMQPAKELIGAVQATVDLSSADAQAYVPDQLADVRARLSGLRVQFAERHYGAVVAEAPAVLARAQGLAAAAAAKKGEILKAYEANWSQFAASVPVSFETLQTRIAVLGRPKMGRLAAGIDLARARAGLADARLLWSKAQAGFAAGNLEEAVNAARVASGKAAASAALLGMQQSRRSPAD